MKASSILTLLLVMAAISYGQNNCTVVAKMSPEGDSVSPAPVNIQIQNASINATGYQFFLNGMAVGMNQPVNIYLQPGLMIVKLVAYNGNCTDTTVSHYFYSGQFPADTANLKRAYGFPNRELEMNGLMTLNDGSNIIYGRKLGNSYMPASTTGFMLHTTAAGCIKWARNIPVPVNSASNIEQVKEAADGSIYVFASPTPANRVLLKLTAAGDISWTRILINSTGAYENFLGMETLPDGGVITACSSQNNAVGVTRFDANGQVSWQKNYNLNQQDPQNFKNLLLKDGFLYISGSFMNWSTFSSTAVICKISCTNGQGIWTKKYQLGVFIGLGNMVSAGTGIVLNIIAATGNNLRPTIGGVMRIDTDGVIEQSLLVADVYVPNPIIGPYEVTSSRLTKSGQSFYIVTAGASPLSLQGDGRSSKQIRLDAALNVKWVRSNGGIGASRYYFNAPAPNEGSVVGGTASSAGLLSFLNNGTMFQLANVDSSGGNPGAACSFYEPAWEVFQPAINVSPLQWSSETITTNTIESPVIPWQADYPEMRFNCPDYVDSCSYLKLTGPAAICNITQTYLYKTHKNKSCGQPTNWSLSPAVQTILQTDSSILVRFPAFGRYVIYGRNRLSCVPVEDSIVVIAGSNTPPLNLGNDLSVCAGNSLVLHAGNRFMLYEWNNGTTDSVLTVTQPGQYWVKVTDSCNNILRDTIQIMAAPPVPVSIGSDRSVCANDTVHLTATAGFANYQWSPAYQAGSTSGPSIIVNPLVDTSYTVIAEMSPGCLAYDTVHITVQQVPAINLGADKSFCVGDSLVLDAGSGFVSYAWNNAASSPQITVRSPGNYSVLATTAQGCKAYDTLTVASVFSLPTPRLDHDSLLCEGSSRMLNAGNGYTQYSWNTGASTQQISVNTLGLYAVQVTDRNGCKGRDSMRLQILQPRPSLFLPADLTICSYETASLQSLNSYRSYLWSNGKTSPAISVNTPGLYWLEVKDPFGCAGRDSMQVLVKTDCIKGVYVPSVFTPNNDGKNDLFKPLIYGRPLEYSFTIFNRYGAIVFQSGNPTQGWDGKVKGLKQDGNAFVWILNYQLETGSRRQLKGTVILVR